MKKLLIIFTLALLFSQCKKDESDICQDCNAEIWSNYEAAFKECNGEPNNYPDLSLDTLVMIGEFCNQSLDSIKMESDIFEALNSCNLAVKQETRIVCN